MFTSFELRLIFLCFSNRSMKVNYQISCIDAVLFANVMNGLGNLSTRKIVET